MGKARRQGWRQQFSQDMRNRTVSDIYSAQYFKDSKFRVWIWEEIYRPIGKGYPAGFYDAVYDKLWW